MKTIKAVPQTYRGVRFRSTLEADWAASLDALGIAWSYEPEAVQLPSGEFYRPDFWLPEIATWLEVKGPHDERIGKTRELAAAVTTDPDTDGHFVVVGRAPLSGALTFEWADGPGENLVLQECLRCGSHYWLDEWQGWGCRKHARGQGGGEHRNGAMYLSPNAPGRGAWTDMDYFPFQRAPR